MWNSLTSWCKDCLTLPVLEPITAIFGFCDIREEKSKLIKHKHILILFKYFIYADGNVKHAANIYYLSARYKRESQKLLSGDRDKSNTFLNGNQLPIYLTKKNQIYEWCEGLSGFVWSVYHSKGYVPMKNMLHKITFSARGRCEKWGGGAGLTVVFVHQNSFLLSFS